MSTFLDFETRSNINIKKSGAYRYAVDPSTDLICCGIKVGEGPTIIWKPESTYLPEIVPPVYAHNATFDYYIYNYIAEPKYNFPKLHKSDWIDSMAICQMLSLPAALAKAGECLNLNIQKDRRGTLLINKICSPPFSYNHEDLIDFYEYCKRDVDTLYELVQALPFKRLPKKEQELWLLTLELNIRGLPIDVYNLNRVVKAIQDRVPVINKELHDITNGSINTVSQVTAITAYINSLGEPLPNLQANTIKEYLLRDDTDPQIERILELRRDFGGAAVKKFNRMVDMVWFDRVHDYIRYHAASTGRWAGSGIQIQNFPRAQSKNVEEDFKRIPEVYNPVTLGKSLTRSIICAGRGKTLISVDYSSIEYVLALWLAKDWYHAQRFDAGRDSYIDMAAIIYGVDAEEVTKEQRQFGKVVVLQAQYQAGGKGLYTSAKNWGLTLEFKESFKMIAAWRKEYALVVQCWWDLASAAQDAVTYEGKSSTIYGCTFLVSSDKNNRKWLTLKLPSGRFLYYAQPSVELKDVEYHVLENDTIKKKTMKRDVLQHWGIDSKTKKWSLQGLHAGRIFENIVQALARDVLAEAKIELMSYGLLASVHDELIFEVDEDKAKRYYELIEYGMCERPKWAKGLPLKVDGWIGKRFRK